MMPSTGGVSIAHLPNASSPAFALGRGPGGSSIRHVPLSCVSTSPHWCFDHERGTHATIADTNQHVRPLAVHTRPKTWVSVFNGVLEWPTREGVGLAPERR